MVDMTGFLLVSVILPLIILIILYFISRTLFHILLRLMSLLFLVTLIIGGYAVYTTWQFSKTLQEEPQLYVYETLEHPRAAFLNPPLKEAGREPFWYDGNLTRLKEQAGVIFIIHAAFYNATITTTLPGNLTVSGVPRILESDDPFRMIAERISREQGYPVEQVERVLKEQYGNDPLLLKDMLFAMSIGMLLEDDPARLIRALREGMIEVMPEPFFLRILPYIPADLLRLAEQTGREAFARLNMTG